MDQIPIIVLPELDGTNLLLDRFVALAPDSQQVSVLTLPDDPSDGYDSLCDLVAEQLKHLDSCHVVAADYLEAKQAVLDYRVLGRDDRRSWLEIEMLTGRTHRGSVNCRRQLLHGPRARRRAVAGMRDDCRIGTPPSQPV